MARNFKNGYYEPVAIGQFMTTLGVAENPSVALETTWQIQWPKLGVFQKLHKDELIVLCGKPGIGKSRLMLELAWGVSNVQALLFATYDLSTKMAVARLIDTAHLNSVGFEPRMTVDGLMKNERLLFDEHVLFDFDVWAERMRKCCEDHKIKVLLIDDLNHMGNAMNIIDVCMLLSKLKAFARTNGICLLCSYQVDRFELRSKLMHYVHRLITLERSEAQKSILILEKSNYANVGISDVLDWP